MTAQPRRKSEQSPRKATEETAERCQITARIDTAFIAYGLLSISVIVLLFPSCPWLSLLVPVIYAARDWVRSLPVSSRTTRVFAPDPLKPDLREIGVAMSSAVNETKLEISVDWLLCPFCSEKSFQPYSIDYSDKKRKLILTSGKMTVEYPVDVRMKFESPLPLMVEDRPLRITIQSYKGFALLKYCQQPKYSWMLLPKFAYLALYLSLLIMYHFAVKGTILDKPDQQFLLAFLALVFPASDANKHGKKKPC